VDDRALIGALADAVQKAVDETTGKLVKDFAGAFSDYAGYFVRFREAPALIVPAFKSLTVLSNLVESALTAEEEKRIGEMELFSGLISASLAIQNLMLCAHSLGLGTSCMTGPLLAEGELKILLDIPPAWRIAAFIPVGYPAETPAPVARKSAESVMRWVERKPVAADGTGGNGESKGHGNGHGNGDG
jgi:nitroreductase